MLQTKQLGLDGEELVAKYLKKQGFTVIAKNYQTRVGEVDIIAQRDEFLVFVEVKTRRNPGFPIGCVITTSKQKKIIKTAKYFIVTRNVVDKVCRFDVATVIYGGPQGFEIDYIENAFY